MKKNTIKFWFKNRLTFIFLAWMLFAIFATCNPYLNGLIFVILFFGTLFFTTYIFEEHKANASERLMWMIISKIFDYNEED